MNKMTFKGLLEKKGFTLEKIAEQLQVSAVDIRKWICQELIPSVEIIKQLAALLKEHEETIFEVFAPKHFASDIARQKQRQLADAMVQLFYDIHTMQDYVSFCAVFGVKPTNGVVLSGETEAFSFSKVHAEIKGEAVVLADADDNMVILTQNNVRSVEPIFVSNDVYMFELVLSCPVFPIKEAFDPDSFSQKIQVLYF